MISALPDIKKLIIQPEDEFMILACDGIWNYMSSEEVVDFVRTRLTDENKKMSEICEEVSIRNKQRTFQMLNFYIIFNNFNRNNRY